MSDQDIDTTEYSEEHTDDLETVEAEAGEQQEAATESPESEAGGDDAGSDYVETDDPKVLARFGHLTRQKTEAEKRALQERREREKLQKRLEELESKRVEPLKEVSAPDPDLAINDPDEFKRQQQAYVAYIRESERREIQGKQQKEQSEAEKQADLQSKVSAYSERAKTLGIEADKLAEAGTYVGSHIPEDLVYTILEDEDGPALTMHLAENVEDLSALLDAKSPYRAGQVIERMRSKLKTAKKPKSPPPSPPTKVKGARTPETERASGWSIS